MGLVIKCGMQSEANLIRKWCPGAVVMTGRQSVRQMQAAIPKQFECTSIISVGLCGGLSPFLKVGDIVTSLSVSRSAQNHPDFAWTNRLVRWTGAKRYLSYSTTEFSTACTPVQKKNMLESTGGWFIDNESIVVQQFAEKFNIPYAVLRVVSDSSTDTIPIAAQSALDIQGRTSILPVIWSLFTRPDQIPDLIRTALNANKAMRSLELALKMAGPRLQSL